jgi:hypothetical protein
MTEDKITIMMKRSNDMSKMTKKKVSNKVGADNPVVTSPHLDKLSAVVDQESALCGLAYNTALEWLETGECGFVKASGTKIYPLALKVHYPVTKDMLVHQKCPHLLLQLTSKKASKPQARLEWNPYYITADSEVYLDSVFTMLFGMGFYEFLFHARFTRADFCRNILLRDLEDYLIGVKWAKHSQCFFGADGKLQSITFAKSGNNQIIVYNKAKQLYGDAAAHGIIRIEARLRLNHTIGQLVAIPNPFDRVKLYSVPCKNLPYGVAHGRAFQDACRLRGIKNAIKQQPLSHRAKLKTAISKQPVTWWDIQPDDWDWLLTDALDNAGLLAIPNSAPPLKLNYLTGCAA